MKLSKEAEEKIIPAFGFLRDTPDGQIIMEYLKGVFLYPFPQLKELCDGQIPTNDERLGHQRVVLHMMSMMDQ